VSTYEQKIVQYLEEAHATEVALIRVLQSQIAMTPRGSTRTAIEEHLDETRGHAERVRGRIGALQAKTSGNPLQAWIGLTEALVGQALALGKAPLDLVRGTGGEEKVLKNAKDDCATEALEIATYTAIERLANEYGDRETARLAADILADERRMLDRLLGEEIPKLTDAVARAEVEGRPSFDPATTGAADAVRTTARRAAPAAAGTDEPPIAGYDDLKAADVVERLPGLSQEQLAAVARYERARDARSTVLERIDALTGDEPWDGYDAGSVQDVRAALRDADEATVDRVRDYERRHKARAGVLEATERSAAKS
jgi:ferritin-like metal-binding protein YciE